MRIELAGTRGNAVRRATVDGMYVDGGRFREEISKLATGAHRAHLRRFSETLNALAHAPGFTKGAT